MLTLDATEPLIIMSSVIRIIMFCGAVLMDCSYTAFAQSSESRIYTTKFKGDSIVTPRYLTEINIYSDPLDISIELDSIGDTTLVSYFYYDQNGNDSLEVWIESLGIDSFMYVYGPGGKLLIETYKWGDDEAGLDSVFNIYNDKGQLIATQTFYVFDWPHISNTDSMYYMNDSLLKRINKFNGAAELSRYETHKYDSKGQKIRSQYFHEDDGLYLISKNKYYANGKRKRYRSKFIQSDGVSLTSTRYNQLGNKVSEINKKKIDKQKRKFISSIMDEKLKNEIRHIEIEYDSDNRRLILREEVRPIEITIIQEYEWKFKPN